MFLLSVRELLRLATSASRSGLQVQGRHIVMCKLRGECSKLLRQGAAAWQPDVLFSSRIGTFWVAPPVF